MFDLPILGYRITVKLDQGIVFIGIVMHETERIKGLHILYGIRATGCTLEHELIIGVHGVGRGFDAMVVGEQQVIGANEPTGAAIHSIHD